MSNLTPEVIGSLSCNNSILLGLCFKLLQCTCFQVQVLVSGQYYRELTASSEGVKCVSSACITNVLYTNSVMMLLMPNQCHVNVIIRYNTIDEVQYYNLCYKPIVLYAMA